MLETAHFGPRLSRGARTAPLSHIFPISFYCGFHDLSFGHGHAPTKKRSVRNSMTTTVIDPNMLDFSNLSTLISNIALIFPGVVSLVVGVVPILFILAIVGLVFSIFGAIVSMIEGLMHSVFK